MLKDSLYCQLDMYCSASVLQKARYCGVYVGKNGASPEGQNFAPSPTLLAVAVEAVTESCPFLNVICLSEQHDN